MVGRKEKKMGGERVGKTSFECENRICFKVSGLSLSLAVVVQKKESNARSELSTKSRFLFFFGEYARQRLLFFR